MARVEFGSKRELVVVNSADSVGVELLVRVSVTGNTYPEPDLVALCGLHDELVSGIGGAHHPETRGCHPGICDTATRVERGNRVTLPVGRHCSPADRAVHTDIHWAGYPPDTRP